LERSYLRLSLKNESGTLGKVAKTLGSYGISITSLVQDEHDDKDGFVPVVILTHEAPVGAIQSALKELSKMDQLVGPEVVRYRLEELRS
jgi:homoserine dehydrogenase